MPKTGVLILGYGGPDSLDAVGPFMQNLTGREPSPELIARVSKRYEAIGGSSPLTRIAGEIAGALEAKLADDGYDVPVRLGMAYWHPFVAEGAGQLRDAGVERVVTIALSPFESKITTGAYRGAVATECQGFEVAETDLLSRLDAFVSTHAAALRTSLEEVPEDALVAFSAHSLPMDEVEADPSYVVGLRSVAEQIAAELGWAAGVEDGVTIGGVPCYGTTEGPQRWLLCFQSKGQKPGPWLGPELEEVISAAAEEGAPAVVASPIGFLTDHMETLYDLDIVAARHAEGCDVAFSRSAVPNDADAVIAALASEVEKHL